MDMRDGPPLHLSRVRLVFGPADSVPALLRALAEALDPLDVVPRELRCSIAADGCRLIVTCDLDPVRPDLARILGRLLRRRRPAPPPPLAWSA